MIQSLDMRDKAGWTQQRHPAVWGLLSIGV